VSSADSETFRARHAIWMRAMRGEQGDDPHAVMPNLVAQTWNIACGRCRNSRRVHSSVDTRQTKAFTHLVEGSVTSSIPGNASSVQHPRSSP